jgi:hypothetical protein
MAAYKPAGNGSGGTTKSDGVDMHQIVRFFKGCERKL